MPSLVIIAVERPLDLIGVNNGELDPALLSPVGPRGQLHHLAARAWASLCRAAKVAGWPLTYTYGGTYRPLLDQELLFIQRYTTVPQPGRPTKLWKGQTWYLRQGASAAATPGTSNHGLGLAIDMALGSDPAHAVSVVPALDWLADHAPRFGFSWESVPDEPWHVRYVTGDRIPQAVIDWEPKPEPPKPNPQPPNPPEDEMQPTHLHLASDTKGEWLLRLSDYELTPYKDAKSRDSIVAALELHTAPISDAQLFAFRDRNEKPG